MADKDIPRAKRSWWPFKRSKIKKGKDGFEINDWAWEGAFKEEFLINRDTYIKRFKPEEKGAHDGAELNPPSEAEAPSEFENKLRDTFDADMQKQIGNRISVLNRVEAELEKTTIENPSLQIRKITDDVTSIEIPRIIERDTPKLTDKKVAAGYAERSYNLFKTRHRRLEEPSEGRKIQFVIIVAVTLILIEGMINLYFFQGSLEFGAIAAGAITFSVAAINVILALLAGHTVGKATNYIPRFWIRKTLGWIGSILYFLIISTLHLGFGIYRNIVDENQSLDGALTEAGDRVQETWDQGDWASLLLGEGTLLAGVGIAFAIIAFYEGMAVITDKYPGYAAIKRRTMKRQADFAEAWEDTKEDVEDEFDDAIDAFDDLLATNEAKIVGFKKRAREFTQLASVHRREVARAELIFQSLIKAYRDANKAHRNGVPTPMFFDVPPMLLENIAVYDGVLLDKTQAELNQHFEQAKKLILDAKVNLENEKQKEFRALASKLADIEGKARDIITQNMPKIDSTTSDKFEF